MQFIMSEGVYRDPLPWEFATSPRILEVRVVECLFWLCCVGWSGCFGWLVGCFGWLVVCFGWLRRVVG